jgi:unsaturated rhamnogalacturonyl hydrolase
MKWYILFIGFLIVGLALAQSGEYEGYGSVTKGGEGQPVYHVTSLKDDGRYGTLRDALSQGNRYVVFDTAGTIVITEDLEIKGSNVTIDGSAAPFPGVTLKKSRPDIVALIIKVRVYGLMDKNADTSQNHAGTIAMYTRNAGSVRNIIIDHVTTRNAIDSGLDIWGEIHNVTIQYSLIAYSYHPQTISHYGGSEFKKRRNISIHHNVYARNNERNPQLRADVRNLDYVNNIVYDWGYWDDKYGYGIRLKNKWRPGEPKVTINIVNNLFIATRKPAWALVYGKDAGSEENDQGPDQVLPQGKVYKESDMDSLYVSGNILPKENMDQYSTIEKPLPIPEYAKVTTYLASELADSVASHVGTHYPLEDEQEIFDAIRDSLQQENEQSWSVRMVESIMKRHPVSWTVNNMEEPRWGYQEGLVMKAILEVWQRTGDDTYWNYAKSYYDTFISKDKIINYYDIEEYNIDRINAGKPLFLLYGETGDENYKNAIFLLRKQMKTHPRTNVGGFWHKQIYPYQMWVDGLYMASPFLAQFAKTFEEQDLFDDVVKQFILMEKYARDEETGLLYHGWDESRQQRWADPESGLSSQFWGRGMGWYAMALVDVLDFLPKDHAQRPEIIAILQRLSIAITKFQDSKTGLWYQVVDQANRQGNYLESSASSMFVYSLAKAVNKGYIDNKFLENARLGYNGILKQFIEVDGEGLVHIHKACAGAGLGGNPYRDGSYEYYINERIRSNDPKAMGPFILATLELESGKMGQ